MRSLVYPGLSGLSGAACLLAAAILSRIEGNVVAPQDYRLLSASCWLGLAAGLVGAVWALVLRTRSARKEMSTLVISFCFAVVAASVWVRIALLPNYIGVPLTVPLNRHGANQTLQATPGLAFLFFAAQRPGAPELGCSSEA